MINVESHNKIHPTGIETPFPTINGSLVSEFTTLGLAGKIVLIQPYTPTEPKLRYYQSQNVTAIIVGALSLRELSLHFD